MEMTAAKSLTHSHVNLPSVSSSSSSPYSKASVFAYNSAPFQCSKVTLSSQLQYGFGIKARKHRTSSATFVPPIHASEADTSVTDVEDRWLLEPVGDGDFRHIGYKVKMPDAFEIVSNEVTVGRLPEKANMVIPVATVSGVHARIQKKGENLLVTDLDSTNGTFINEKRMRPGVVTAVPSGSFITFGDIHLAMFRASKIENVEVESKPEEKPEDTSSSQP